MKITRSFTRKIQIKQFEPIDSTCSVEMELGKQDSMEEKSKDLDEFCRAEVEKTIQIEINKRKDVDKAKIHDVANDEAELDAGITDV